MLTLAAAFALILLTTYLHQITTDMAETIESARLGSELQVDLLQHARLSDVALSASDADSAVARVALERVLASKLREMARHARGPSEARVLDRATGTIAAYMALRRDAEAEEAEVEPVIGRTYESLEVAIGELSHLVALNLEESRGMQRQAATWDRMGNVIATVIAVALVAGVSAALGWFAAYVFRPLLLTSDGIRRFAAGERGTRLPEIGPAEVSGIARAFNGVTAALAAHEERRLTFLAGVAHDLRNPLHVLRLSTTLAEKETSPDRLRRALVVANRQVTRLDRMVADLLDNVRIEAGQLELRLEQCDAREVVRAVLDLYADGAPGHDLTTAVPDVSCLVRCDPARLEQVLGNLVSNAIKYSPNGGRVRVTLTAAAGSAVIEVTDEGIGILPEDREHIFEPFRRGASSDGGAPGAGLGLAVARRIVVAHGGTIEVESRAGTGSTFRIRLPLAGDSTRCPPDDRLSAV
jgi:signal transduction histidine kinase